MRSLSIVLAASLASTAGAVSAPRMNLEQIVKGADRAFRGTVVQAAPGTVRFAGRDLPMTTYRIRVDEAFKGRFAETKGVRHLELRMLGDAKNAPPRKGRTRTIVPGVPSLEVGASYLLLTTAESRIGFASPVGLEQGVFRVRGPAGREEATSGRGQTMRYPELAGAIRALVARGGGR